MTDQGRSSSDAPKHTDQGRPSSSFYPSVLARGWNTLFNSMTMWLAPFYYNDRSWNPLRPIHTGFIGCGMGFDIANLIIIWQPVSIMSKQKNGETNMPSSKLSSICFLNTPSFLLFPDPLHVGVVAANVLDDMANIWNPVNHLLVRWSYGCTTPSTRI